MLHDRVVPLGLAALALTYAIAVVVVAWQVPDKGFLSFVGRRVVHVDPGSEAERRGLRAGDVIESIDGRTLVTTLDYATRFLERRPGERVVVGVRRETRTFSLHLTMRSSGPPWAALVATALAALLLALGLVAIWGRPGEASRRFWRTTLVYAVVYTGTLSWNHLLLHPWLALPFFVGTFVAPPLAMDFTLVFPRSDGERARRWRVAGWSLALVGLAATLVAVALAIAEWRSHDADETALRWTARLTGGQITYAVVVIAIGVVAQYRQLSAMRGAERSQLKWLLFGLGLCAVPLVAGIPFALRDLGHFLLVESKAMTGAMAVLWFVAASLAVLRVRLADVDRVIHRSLVYGIATSTAVAVYVIVALLVSVVAETLVGPHGLLAHLLAALAAAVVFGPIRTRVQGWLDRRFFRDRLHYVRALRELADAISHVRTLPALAQHVAEQAAQALRASGAALFLEPRDGAPDEPDARRPAHAVGSLTAIERAEPPDGGLAVPIRRDTQQLGTLVLGPRLGGDLYSSDDRDLIHAFAAQLTVAVENARSFGTIAAMNETLEKQNLEIRELRDRLEDENAYLKRRLDAGATAAIVGTSRTVRELRESIARVAATSSPVLLQGESGTGKGLVARVLHESSERRAGPFIQVDCGAVPAGVFESELFGHERGAFTGAIRTRRGAFELADGGTLLLDEIGELPLALQPKLLRVLAERSFTRVGGNRAVAVDARIVAATNRNLQAMVRRGDFREDLYYRLSVIVLEVPPLRARSGDIEALATAMLPELCRRNGQPMRTLSASALERLAAHPWPGNVRELANALERAVVLCTSDAITETDLGLPERVQAPSVPPPPEADHRDVMTTIEKERLLAALHAAGGNRSTAAKALGIPRTTLINKMRRHGIG
ncbi:MAG: sigma 54-interacting transcriptional regulator [Deltaproteobacteria bacterium]|nr:sigma 54-interacting transcriptional regulator [Deltaproteobacteria bacterium]